MQAVVRALAVVVALSVFVALAACGGGAADSESRMGITEILAGGDVDGYARALAPRAFEFPADHGPHPEFRSEWWYFTGNLVGERGRRFGFHLTFFRNALRPSAPEPRAGEGSQSAWRTRQMWMAHFALVDIDGQRVVAAERFARGVPGLAGAQAEPFAVEVDDWSARAESTGTEPRGVRPEQSQPEQTQPEQSQPERTGLSTAGSVARDAAVSFGPIRLRARDSGAALDLRLEGRKPIILHGDRGLSQKSGTPGNASFYYAITRCAAEGRVTIGDDDYRVSGSAWFDREWSTSALAANQVGWDWFALQLSDGRDLVWYRMRRRDGSTDPFSKGLLVAADGTVTHLGVEDVSMRALRVFRSPRSGGEYPVEWQLRVPSAGLDLTVRAAVDDQELDLTFRYFEGAVAVAGTSADAPITGRGYLEMTGYVPE